MKYDPKEVESAANEEFPLLPDGEYEAEVIECEETVSKKGDPMFAIKLNIPDPKGGKWGYHIYDYISPNWFQKKFKSFFASMGQEKMYETGDIDAALLIHQFVTADIGTEDEDEQWPAKNVVLMYVKPEVAKAKNAPVVDAKDNSDLPF